ncbi:MAG: hypothetical protein ACHQT6_12075 [Candidatus Acidiferrales bacterium]
MGKAQQRSETVKESTQTEPHPERQLSLTSTKYKECPTTKTQAAKDQTPGWYKSPEWVLVLVGVITCIVIGWQSSETRKSAQAAKESLFLTHRPKLIVRNVISPQVETLHPLASVEDLVRSNAGDRFEGYFQVANIGNTPAVIQSIHERIFVGDRLPMERQYSSNKISEIRLAAGESRRVEMTPVNVPPETQGVIVRERINVYFMGLITYTDSLGIRRETAFCRRLDRALQRLVPLEDSDYEYAD